MAYTPTEWKNGDLITAEKMSKLEQGVQNEQVGPQGPQGEQGPAGAKGDKGDPGEGLTGTASPITKLAGTEEAPEIATKVNEMIDALIARGICTASE